MSASSKSCGPSRLLLLLLVLVGLMMASGGSLGMTPEAQPAKPSGEAVRAPLVLGVVGFYNPRLMYLKYQPLADFLSAHTGRSWRLAISTTYEQTVTQLCEGKLTLAYLGPYAYLRAHEACGAIPLIRLNTDGEASYRSFIMVRESSPIRHLEQLRGKRVGFGAPLSVSSHLQPRNMLLKAGLHGGEDYHCIYLGHHDRAARAVLLGDVDACGVRDIIGRKFLQRGLRILASSPPIPNFPLVAGAKIDADTRERILDALVYLPAGDSRVAREITGWDEELAGGFVPTSDEDFDAVRELARENFGPQALSLPQESIVCSPETP